MRAHEAGALHAEGYGGPPHWLPWPTDVMELQPQLWPQTVDRDDAGRLTVGGVDVVSLAREFGTAAYVIDEADFRARARAFRDDFAAPFADLGGRRRVLCGQGVPVHRGRPVGRRRGAVPRRLLRRRAGGGSASGLPGRADRLARQQQVGGGDPPGPRVRRGPDRRRLVRGDRADRHGRCRARRPRAGHGAGHGRRRGAHPRVHRHRPRGPEVRLQPLRWSCGGGGGTHPRPPRAAGAAGAAQPHRLTDLRHVRLRGVRPAVDRPARRGRPGARRAPARARPRWRLRHRVHLRAHAPGTAASWASRWPTWSVASSRPSGTARRTPPRRGSRSSPGARSSARAPSPCTRSAPSRTSRSVGE